jgi:hypothetical protein
MTMSVRDAVRAVLHGYDEHDLLTFASVRDRVENGAVSRG